MASAGIGAVRLVDKSGDALDDDSGKLNVNATLVAGATIDIGDVDMFLDGGTAILGGAGAVAAGVLRVTLASDDVHWGTVGTAADADGTAHGQLRYIANSFANMQTELESTGLAIDNVVSQTALPLKNLGSDTYTEGSTYSYAMAAVRNDTLAALAGTDNEFAPLQVNAAGALYVSSGADFNVDVIANGMAIFGESKIIDGSALPNTVGEGKNARLAVSRSGIAYTCLTDDAGASDLGTTITTHLSEIEGAVETIEGAVSGSEMQVDIVSSAALTVDLGSNNDVTVTSGAITSSHDITGMVSDMDDDVGTTAEKLHTASDVAIKRIDIQAHPDNTGYIFVGDSGVAGNGSGGGIRLAAGDFYSLDIDNTGDVYVAGSVADENVSYIYYT